MRIGIGDYIFLSDVYNTKVWSIVNIIFQTMLQSLTDLERHMSLTNYSLSFSIKLTVFTFVNSAIVPLMSNVIMNTNKYEINYELLVSNIFMMFIDNKHPIIIMRCLELFLNLLKLREVYNLSLNEKIYIRKIDVKQEGMKIPKILYDVYSKWICFSNNVDN